MVLCSIYRAGNEGLCGGPLRKCGKTSKGSIIVVVIAVGLALGAIGAVIFILSCRSKPVSSVEAPSSKSGSEKKTEIGGASCRERV